MRSNGIQFRENVPPFCVVKLFCNGKPFYSREKQKQLREEKKEKRKTVKGERRR